MNSYNIPIVLFTFKRVEKLLIILDRISAIKPSKIYILSDGGRNAEEHTIVEKSRSQIEDRINWNCTIVKRYSNKNIGVYENIAGGAKWVFEKEEFAIFLEDDNLPNLSFFPFCEELLYRYKDDTRILWICGTNYLREYEPKDGCSYVFTQHMLPCGWASWASKFPLFYDGELSLWEDKSVRKQIKKTKYNHLLMKQDRRNWDSELRNKKIYKRFFSWDFQMGFSLRVHGLLGIAPKYNQIENIGVDLDSIHGGTSFDNIMTRRFCGIPTKSIEFPMKHPKTIQPDALFEQLTAKIIVLPFQYRLKSYIARFIKKIFFMKPETSITGSIYKFFLEK